MSALTPGKRVTQIIEPISGTVQDIKWNQDAKAFEVLVAYTQDGEEHTRWFLDTQVAETVDKATA